MVFLFPAIGGGDRFPTLPLWAMWDKAVGRVEPPSSPPALTLRLGHFPKGQNYFQPRDFTTKHKQNIRFRYRYSEIKTPPKNWWSGSS